MIVRELYDLMEKKDSHWYFSVCVEGIDHSALAYANSHYDIEGTNKIDHLYSVKDLFNHEVVSFCASYNGIYVKIDKFPGMRYTELQLYTDKNGKVKARNVIKVWNFCKSKKLMKME